MRNRIGILVTISFTIALPASMHAQTYIEQGRLLETNPRRGSAGLNRALPPSTVDSNRIVTGNVTGGRSFSGFSPIRNSNSLFLSSPTSGSTLSSGFLPSASLSTFERDSVSVNDVRQGARPWVSRPYYSSDTVVSSGGIARGLNQPGSSQVLNPYSPPAVNLSDRVKPQLLQNRRDRSNAILSLPSQLTRISDGRLSSGRVKTMPQSALFRQVRNIPLSEIAARAEQEVSGPSVVLPLRLHSRNGFVDSRLTADFQDPRLRLPSLDNMIEGRPESANRVASGMAASESMMSSRIDNRISSPVDPSRVDSNRILAPGETGDVFAQMRRTSRPLQIPLRPTTEADALAEASTGDDPRAGGLTRPLEPPREGEEDTRDGISLAERSELAEQVSARTLRTFVGSQDSVINRYLARAEDLMREGKYYNASQVYDLAYAVNAQNPLPLIGESMALLAAGDYVSSSRSLREAIDQFEELSRFQVDLKSFVPDIEILDRRRADMEQRLENAENFDLRFLLGWTEYCSGMQPRGVENMSKALMQAPDQSDAIRRFVEDLREQLSAPTPEAVETE